MVSYTDLSLYFFPSTGGNILLTCFLSKCAPLDAPYVLIFPPFAEELNKSRRMLSLQAKQLNKLGYHVVLPDLFGTGDSEGDFSEATWQLWLSDVENIVACMKKDNKNIVGVLGVRLGALLAVDSLRFFNEKLKEIIFWQPVLRGESAITQFLRIRMAADVAAGNNKSTPKVLRQQLLSGRTIEVGGYELNSELVSAIDELSISDLEFPLNVKIKWFEVAPTERASISPAAKKVESQLIDKNVLVESRVVYGSPFWNSVEIQDVPELLEVTTDSFTSSI